MGKVEQALKMREAIDSLIDKSIDYVRESFSYDIGDYELIANVCHTSFEVYSYGVYRKVDYVGELFSKGFEDVESAKKGLEEFLKIYLDKSS